MNLLNAFATDPPLDPVIGRTWGRSGRAGNWRSARSALARAFYRTTLDDDLIFAVTETGGAPGFSRISTRRAARVWS